MKKLLLVVVAITVGLITTGSLLAEGKIGFGIGADVAIPMTTGFSDTQSIGIGGTAKVYYPLSDPMITLTGTAGYMTFSGKDFTPIGGGATVKAGSWTMIPILVGARYYFSPATSSFRPYGAFEMGLIFGSYTLPSVTTVFGTFGGGSVSTSDFSYQPQIGFEASKFDVAARYLGVSGAASVAFRVGYMFN